MIQSWKLLKPSNVLPIKAINGDFYHQVVNTKVFKTILKVFFKTIFNYDPWTTCT